MRERSTPFEVFFSLFFLIQRSVSESDNYSAKKKNQSEKTARTRLESGESYSKLQ